ncbi:MAG: MarR family winged helix-turn-helix transcriptional regulator [Pseudomonadota bacterium]
MTAATEEMLSGIRTILRTFTVDETRFPPAEGRIKYNSIDFQTLYFLEATPGCSNAELARHLGVRPTSAQSTCDRLIKRAFVRREPSDANLRAVALFLTEEGRSVVAAIKRQDLANCERMLAALPAGQRATFVTQITRIADSLLDG